MLNNFGFHPSKVEDDIYDIIEPFEMGIDRYEVKVVDVIIDFLHNNYPYIKYTYWAGSNGFCISFVDGGYPHMIAFDLVESEDV